MLICTDRLSTWHLVTLADDVAALIGTSTCGTSRWSDTRQAAPRRTATWPHGEERITGVAFPSAVLPFLLQTDDNPEGLPGELGEAAVAQFRSDQPTGSPTGRRASSSSTSGTTSHPP